MNKTMYEADAISLEIQKVKVTAETDKTIIVDGRKKMKRSGWINYYDTIEEAVQFKIDGLRENVLIQQQQLAQAIKELMEGKRYYRKLINHRGQKP